MTSLAVKVSDNLLVRRAERDVYAAAKIAFEAFAADIVATVRRGEDFDDDVWQRAVDEHLLPALGAVFARAYDAQTVALGNSLSAATPRTSTDARENAERYLRTIRNRLSNVSDTLFKQIRTILADGVRDGLSDEELAAAVAAALDSTVRARLIARTETTPALNSGRLQAARAVARETGVSTRGWAKEWVSMHDERVRHSHAVADGQVVPINNLFTVGDHRGRFPGDPKLPPGETINCRCTLRIEAGRSLTSAGANDDHDGLVIVALPAADDPIQQVGGEEKHITLCWLGDSEESVADYDEMEHHVREAAQYVIAPFTADVTETGELGDDGAWVAHLDPDQPTQVRNALMANKPVADAVDGVEQFPTYRPHVTLSYTAHPDYSGPVRFDRIALWQGNNHDAVYPLRGEEIGDTEMADDVVDFGDLDPETSVPWHGVLAPETVLSGDRRKFAKDALSFRDLPVPLLYQDATADGHDGAVRVANITGMSRGLTDEGVPVMRAWGLFDAHDTADEAIRQIAKQMLRGVSVDVDSAEFSFEDEFGNDIGGKSAMEVPNPIMVLTSGRVSGATLCSIPAFQEAFVALGEPPEEWGVNDIEDVMAETDSFALDTIGFVSDKPWSGFTQADYTDDQWFRACVLHKNGDSRVKGDNGLPIREPSGALNRNAVHAAAGRFNQVNASSEAKAAAARALRGAYKAIGEQAPDALTAAGGKPRDDLLDSEERPGTGEGGGKPKVSNKPWGDFSMDDYTDEQWARATALHYKAGYSSNKKDHALPYREPNGAFNVEGIRKAAADYPNVKADGAAKAAARRRLQRAFDVIGEDAPATIAQSAGEKTERSSEQVETFDDSGIPGHMPQKLKSYWTHGEGAGKIAWGTGGDFERCRTNLGAYVPKHMLSGLCAKLHKAATGEWPGKNAHSHAVGDAAPAFSGHCEPCAAGLTASASVQSDYANPALERLTPLTVTPDGRIFGHLAGWGTCHIGFDGVCVTPPASVADYAYFQTGEVLTSDGWSIPVGHITMGTGHAQASLRAAPAVEHYDNTGTVVADIAAGDDTFGIWVAGRVRDSATEEQIDALRAGALSGDWRRIGGNMELVAALAVNVPGFPIPRLRAAMQDNKPLALVASGIVTGTGPASGSITDPVPIGHAIGEYLRRQKRYDEARATVDARAAEDRRRRARAAVEAVLATAGDQGEQ